MKRKPKAFISYGSKDSDFANQLANDLRAVGVGVWFDKWEIQVGESIIQKIQEGISTNDFLIIVLSPASVNSSWVQRELNAAMMRELEERSVVILPILISECNLPTLLREKRYADFRSSYEVGFGDLINSITNLLTATSDWDPAQAIETEWGFVRRLSSAPSINQILALTEDTIARLWSIPAGKLSRAIFRREPIVDASLSPTGDFTVIASNPSWSILGGVISVFKTLSADRIRSDFMGANVRSIACMKESILVGMHDGNIIYRSYQSKNGSVVARAPFPLTQLVTSADESTIAMSGHDTGVVIGKMNGEIQDVRVSEKSRIYDMALSPEGDTLACATAQYDGLLIVNTINGQELFRPHSDQVSAVAFSQTGKLLAAGDWDGGLYIYEAPQWEAVGAVRAHRRMIGALTFCSDKYLASGGGKEDPTIRVWDLQSKKLACTITGSI